MIYAAIDRHALTLKIIFVLINNQETFYELIVFETNTRSFNALYQASCRIIHSHQEIEILTKKTKKANHPEMMTVEMCTHFFYAFISY